MPATGARPGSVKEIALVLIARIGTVTRTRKCRERNGGHREEQTCEESQSPLMSYIFHHD